MDDDLRGRPDEWERQMRRLGLLEPPIDGTLGVSLDELAASGVELTTDELPARSRSTKRPTKNGKVRPALSRFERRDGEFTPRPGHSVAEAYAYLEVIREEVRPEWLDAFVAAEGKESTQAAYAQEIGTPASTISYRVRKVRRVRNAKVYGTPEPERYVAIGMVPKELKDAKDLLSQLDSRQQRACPDTTLLARLKQELESAERLRGVHARFHLYESHYRFLIGDFEGSLAAAETGLAVPQIDMTVLIGLRVRIAQTLWDMPEGRTAALDHLRWTYSFGKEASAWDALGLVLANLIEFSSCEASEELRVRDVNHWLDEAIYVRRQMSPNMKKEGFPKMLDVPEIKDRVRHYGKWKRSVQRWLAKLTVVFIFIAGSPPVASAAVGGTGLL